MPHPYFLPVFQEYRVVLGHCYEDWQDRNLFPGEILVSIWSLSVEEALIEALSKARDYACTEPGMVVWPLSVCPIADLTNSDSS